VESDSVSAYPELQPVTERSLRRHPLHPMVRARSQRQTTRGELLFYLGVNAALLFGLVQCVRTFVGDSLNLSRLMHSQASVQSFYAKTRQENRLLNHKIRLYSSPSGIEELARNYLNMVGENELPVRFQ
jgi:cell division protein FtsB